MSTLQATTTHDIEHLADRAELARKCLYYMKMMREIEDRIERKLYRQGKILGGVYVGRGQEAIPVGIATAARPEDVLLPSPPRHGRLLHPRRVRRAASSPSTWAAWAA